MIHDKVRNAINEQIKHELESAYLYQAMAAWFHGEGFDGMGHWMRIQALEEMTHAQKFFNYVLDRDGKVELMPLGLKKTAWNSPLEVFQDAYEHEQWVTSKINGLVTTAREVNDNATITMLDWFISEQVEEEATAAKIASDLLRVGDNGYGLLMLDRELSARIFTPPVGGATAGT